MSKARNYGLSHINKKNQFVTFIDDSDIVSFNFFKEAEIFFEKHKSINIAMTPIKIFEKGSYYEHSLNDKFKHPTGVIDIIKDFQYVQYHIGGGGVFRSEIFNDEKNKFDTKIDFWEDAKLINTVILHSQKYGLLKEAAYYYDRNNSNSLSNKAWNNKSRYVNHIKNNYIYLINLSLYEYNTVIKYVQNLIVKHYLNYMYQHNQEKLLKLNNYQYKLFIDISDLNDNVIVKVNSLSITQRIIQKLKNKY